MKVISGTYKGRAVRELHGSVTHPMSEKLRGALFNALGDINGLSVLDAFAGTGAIGFEAVSRGAQQVTMIDSDLRAIQSMKQTSLDFGVEKNMTIFHQSVQTWLIAHGAKMFDIIVLDPPHDNIQEKLLVSLSRHCIVRGIVVMCLPSPCQTVDIENFEQVRQKSHGNTQLVFYRRLK